MDEAHTPDYNPPSTETLIANALALYQQELAPSLALAEEHMQNLLRLEGAIQALLALQAAIAEAHSKDIRKARGLNLLRESVE